MTNGTPASEERDAKAAERLAGCFAVMLMVIFAVLSVLTAMLLILGIFALGKYLGS